MRPPPPNALVNKIVALTLCLLVFSGTLGLGAVWVRQEIYSTANRSRTVQLQIADVERHLDEVNAEVAAALNPASLLRQNEAMRLGLVAPREVQVVRVDESPELRLAAKRNREAFSLAAAAEAPVNFRVVSASYTR
ncbi:MAG: hypothetical protein HYV95_16745 [Opitutae bacterium]|nr:hypothetical protein [Opitutae bacterium]